MQSPKHISESENQHIGVAIDSAVQKSPIKSPINFSRPYGEFTPKLSRSEDLFGTPSTNYTELHKKFEQHSKSNTIADLTKIATLRTSQLHSPMGPSEPTRRMISNVTAHKSYGNLDIVSNQVDILQTDFGQDGQKPGLPKKNSLFARSKARLTGQNKSSESNSSTHSHSSRMSRFNLKRTTSLASIKETIDKTSGKVRGTINKSGTKVMALKALYEPSTSASTTTSPNKLRKSTSANKQSAEIPRTRVAPCTYSSPAVANDKDTLISTLRTRVKSLEQRLDVVLEENDALKKENRELKQLVELMLQVGKQQKGCCTGSAGLDGAESSEDSSSTVLRT